MPSKNKVIWSQGMFLRPQHFQQLDEYLQRNLSNSFGYLNVCPWGFEQLTIDREALSLGKLALKSASGLFADGTQFNLPDDDLPPLALNVPTDMKEKIIYLCLPAQREGVLDYNFDEEAGSLARFNPAEIEVSDNASSEPDSVAIQVGKLNITLLDETSHLDPYITLGVARVVEVRSDGHVVLDENFIPPALSCSSSQPMADMLSELFGLLKHRGESLAGRVGAAGRGGASDISDFLLLQLVNRNLPLLEHLSNFPSLHPESFYRYAVSLAGELATFTSATKFSETFPVYDHDNLQGSYKPVMKSLRHSLSMVIEQSAISLPLNQRKYGISVATLPDPTLIDSAGFVLAVNAAIPPDELRKRLPLQIKIAPVEKIRDFVNSQLPGIGIRPLAAAPRQIPFLAGYSYFELDKSSEYWSSMKNSGGFAFHIGGEFPELEINFWAIRQ